MVRSFVAVDLPESFIPGISELQEGLGMEGVKLVEPSLVHVTLKFLGEIPEKTVARVGEALRAVDCPRFEAQVKGVGVFPSPRRIRVVWLGVEGREFQRLHREVERVLTPFNFKKDNRGFQAHATLARVKYPNPKLAVKIKGLEGVNLGSFQVENFHLKKSTLTPQGPIYENLKTIPLK